MAWRLAWRGVRDLFRQPWPLALTVTAVAVAVYLGGLFSLVLATLDAEFLRNQGQAQFQVYWQPGADPDLVARQWTWMRALPYLADLHTFTPGQALEVMRQSLGRGADLTGLAGDNPLPYTALLHFRLPAEDASFARDMYARLTAMDGVAEVRFNPLQVDLAQSFGLVTRRVVWPLAAVLVLLVALVVGNTMRLSLLRRREEVDILRLVGARDWYIRLPLVAGAGFVGAVGALVALGLLKLTQAAVTDVLNVPPLWIRIPFLPTGTVVTLAATVVLVAMAAGYLAAREARP
jgi:cell division transport system permease protein